MLSCLALVVLLISSTVSFADEAELRERISKLESQDSTIGGYGEVQYNRYSRETTRSQMDLTRFVLLIDHRFNDQLSFNSEIEWEHAVASAEDEGEVEIEQANLSYRFGQQMTMKAGLMLIPMGLLNESHEPPAYYGVRRNEVETKIIPTTWREGGLALGGASEAGWGWEAGVTTGFNVAKFDDASKPLGAIHQELQKAKAYDPSVYASVNYRGIAGLLLGGSLFTGNSTQGNAAFIADASTHALDGAPLGCLSALCARHDWRHGCNQPGSSGLQHAQSNG